MHVCGRDTGLPGAFAFSQSIQNAVPQKPRSKAMSNAARINSAAKQETRVLEKTGFREVGQARRLAPLGRSAYTKEGSCESACRPMQAATRARERRMARDSCGPRLAIHEAQESRFSRSETRRKGGARIAVFAGPRIAILLSEDSQERRHVNRGFPVSRIAILLSEDSQERRPKTRGS